MRSKPRSAKRRAFGAPPAVRGFSERRFAGTYLDFDDSAAWHSFAADSVPKGKKKHGGVPPSPQLPPPCPRTNAPPRGAVTNRTLVRAPHLSNPVRLGKNQPVSMVELSHRMLPACNRLAA